METTPRTYGGVPAHERAAARRARLLDATLALVGREGAAAVGVRAVCAEAGLVPRYFYESFADREALLGALLEQVATDAAGVVLAAVQAAPAGDEVATSRAAIDAFVGVLEEDPRRARVLFTDDLASPALLARRQELLGLFAALIAEQARAFYGDPDGDRVVDLTAQLLAGGLAQTLLAWLDGRLPRHDRAALVDDLAALFAATGRAAAQIARGRR